MKKPVFKKIVIIGLGLMGGSLAAAVRKKFPGARVEGIARRPQTIKTALRKKWIHAGGADYKTALCGADLAVICLPVNLIPKALAQIEKNSSAPIFVTDVGSVKAPVCGFAAKRKWKHVRFIGAHPMVGSHEKGIDAARANLYEPGLTVVVSSRDRIALQTVEGFWKKICRKVVRLEAEDHDRRVALISHLPHLLSVCLLRAVGSDKARDISSTGFRDMTRLAHGDPSIWAPIFMQNRLAVLESIELFESNLRQFRSSLINSSEKKVSKILAESSLLGSVR